MNPMALYDALNCASLAVLCAEDGGTAQAEEAFLESTAAAVDAFEPGPLADALNLLRGAVGDFTRGVAA